MKTFAIGLVAGLACALSAAAQTPTVPPTAARVDIEKQNLACIRGVSISDYAAGAERCRKAHQARVDQLDVAEGKAKLYGDVVLRETNDEFKPYRSVSLPPITANAGPEGSTGFFVVHALGAEQDRKTGKKQIGLYVSVNGYPSPVDISAVNQRGGEGIPAKGAQPSRPSCGRYGGCRHGSSATFDLPDPAPNAAFYDADLVLQVQTSAGLDPVITVPASHLRALKAWSDGK